VKTAVALVSARAARGLDEDMPPLLAAFAAAGAHAEIADWDDPEADWARFDAALLRSAWDYTERLPEFLDWIERVDAITTLLNPAPVLRWSADKHYLRDLERLGVPVVATTFVEPGADARETLGEFLEREVCAELVVKPAVGAGSRDTRRHARAASAETLAHVRELLAADRAVLLQPYFEGVDQHGETALIYIDGRFSHAIRKGPLLPLGAPATDGLSFTVESGRILALLGPSGCGKTTTLRLIAGFETPDQGPTSVPWRTAPSRRCPTGSSFTRAST